MSRLSPSNYNPHLAFRFRVQFSSLNNIQFYGKSTTLPSFDNSPITLDYGNTQMFVKGKTKWNEIDMVLYAYERMTINELWGYLNDLHHDVNEARDEYPDTYKKDILIQLLGPTDNLVGTFTLIGAFLSKLNFGQMDWSSEDVVQPSISIRYDYVKYETN